MKNEGGYFGLELGGQYHWNLYNSRLIKVETAAGTNAFTEDAQYNYNVSGQLNRVRIGEIVQGIDYVYTLGGALKSMNHPSLEAIKDPGKDGLAGTPNALVTPDLFGITLDYFQGDYNRAGTNIVTSTNITPNYSGNIMGSRWAIKNAAMDWSTSPPSTTAQQKGYLYNYNRNNWLTEAKFGNANNTGAITTPTAIHREQGLQYDSNGNITKLQRTNDLGTTVDNLTYNYTYTGTNRLNRVTDGVSASFPNDIDSGQLANNYVYNVLGQLTLNKQETTHYVYNTQGLVTEIRQGSLNPVLCTNIVKFFYNEMGHRIRKESTSGGITNITYYVLDASGNAMAIYYKASGGAITQTELPIYGATRLGVFMKLGNAKNYQITDHLGNVRAVAQRVVGSSTVSTFSYADYYPFGEQLQGRSSANNYRYAFQGQEKDNETGLEAFQLRMWDGRLGRWFSPDPYGQYASPYLGMGNNPINSIDPDGGFCFDAQGNSIPCPEGYGEFTGPTNEHMTFGNTFVPENSNMEFITALNEVVVTNNNSSNYFFAENHYGVEATYAGDLLSMGGAYIYNQDFWRGKNGTFYDSSWGGNGSTGGKNKYAKNLSKSFSKWSNRLGYYSVYATYSDYQNGKISEEQHAIDQTVNGVGFLGPYGAAANFGWNLGALISKTEIYNRYMFGVHSQIYFERGIQEGGYIKSKIIEE